MAVSVFADGGTLVAGPTTIQVPHVAGAPYQAVTIPFNPAPGAAPLRFLQVNMACAAPAGDALTTVEFVALESEVLRNDKVL